MGGSLIVLGILGLIGFILFILIFQIMGLWVSALLSGVSINLFQLLFMRIRKVPPSIIVNAMVTTHKAGIKLTRDELEAHFLAGGHVPSVVIALISADKANIALTFQQ